MFSRSLERVLLLGAFLLILATAAMMQWDFYTLIPALRAESAPQPLGNGYQASDERGRLRIDWDTRHQSIERASAGALIVTEAGKTHRYSLDPKVLRDGGLDYLHNSNDFTATVLVQDSGQEKVLATVRSVSPAEVATVVAQTKPAEKPRQGTRSRRR